MTSGVYNLTVDGTGTPGNRSTPLTLTVSGGGGGNNVTVDFSACALADRPVWLASQDGTGPWVVVTGVGNVYSFSITSGEGGMAYVLNPAGGTSSVQVHYQTQAEFTSGTLNFCASTTGKTVNGTAAGLTAFDQAIISLGGASVSVNSLAPNFQLSGVASGTHDLVGYRRSLVGGAEAAIIRRFQNIANNGSVGTVDFAGTEAFVPATATITLAGLVGGETVGQNMFYQVGASCTAASLYFGGLGGASFTASGIPDTMQMASDFHGLFLSATLGSASRSIIEYFHTFAARTVTMGAALPTPTVTSLGGPYKRLRVTATLPADYQTSAAFQYSDAGGKSVFLTATFGYLGSSAADGELPDFSGLPGWDNTWPPASTSTGDWIAIASGRSTTGSVCTEGATVKSATVTGTF